MPRSTRAVLAVLAGSALLLPACADDDAEPDVDVPLTTADEPTTTSQDEQTTTSADEGATTTGQDDETGTSAGAQGTGAAGGQALDPPELDDPVNDHGAVVLEGQQLELRARDFFFDPTFVRVTPGTEASITVTNEGSLPHTFTNEDLGVDVELPPGESQEVRVAIPADAAEEIVYICRFHASQGMRGAFFFEG